jgi:hypothetical protein
VKWQFTLRQLLVALFLVAATLAWFSWRKVWETKATIIVTDAREKARADGTLG